MRRCILDVSPKRNKLGIGTIFICHSVDPDLRIKIFFEKKGTLLT